MVQIFRREDRVSKRFDGYLGRYFDANLKTIFLFAVFFPVLAFVLRRSSCPERQVVLQINVNVRLSNAKSALMCHFGCERIHQVPLRHARQTQTS